MKDLSIMTIAACYHSNEGVILGTDSTVTVTPQNPSGVDVTRRHFNHAQKIFEVGSDSPIGPIAIAYFGLSEMGRLSQRTLVARFASELESTKPSTMDDIARLWSVSMWQTFCASYPIQIARGQHLNSLATRTIDEEKELQDLINFGGGYFIVGRLVGYHETSAFEVSYNALTSTSPTPKIIDVGALSMGGCPNVILRLVNGHDPRIVDRILNSGYWTGTKDQLLAAMTTDTYAPAAILNIRDAVDFVYSMIYSTIKALRFSQSAPLCGGPIEIASITTDRPFRWVMHKALDVAVHRALYNET
jgi:hypothetical protein